LHGLETQHAGGEPREVDRETQEAVVLSQARLGARKGVERQAPNELEAPQREEGHGHPRVGGVGGVEGKILGLGRQRLVLHNGNEAEDGAGDSQKVQGEVKGHREAGVLRGVGAEEGHGGEGENGLLGQDHHEDRHQECVPAEHRQEREADPALSLVDPQEEDDEEDEGYDPR